MPITFDSRQRAALESLRWLYSESEEDRRSGRSTVLAVSYLYRAIESDGRSWVVIEDHVHNRRLNHHLVSTIQDLLYDLSLNDYFEMRMSGMSAHIRLSRGGSHPYHILQRSFVPLSEPLSAGVLKSIQGSVESNFPDLPQTTMWDLITDDD